MTTFNNELFKDQIIALKTRMQTHLRGELEAKTESSIVAELSSIYTTVVDRYVEAVKNGSTFASRPHIADHAPEERVFYALLDLLERMELDFCKKFSLDLTHDLEKEVEIGKIKIAFLDGARRAIHQARTVQ
jgi:hypothetical protein